MFHPYQIWQEEAGWGGGELLQRRPTTDVTDSKFKFIDLILDFQLENLFLTFKTVSSIAKSGRFLPGH
jgi:hypothetical protein